MPTLFQELLALYEDQDEIHAGEDGDTLPQGAPQGGPGQDALDDEQFQQQFQEMLNLGPETPEFQEALSKLLEANPQKAQQLIEEIGQSHPELLQELEQGDQPGADGEQPPPDQAPAQPQQPQPGEQNSAGMGSMNLSMPSGSSKVPSHPPASAKGRVQYSLPGRAVRTGARAAKEVAGAVIPAYGAYRAARRVAGYQVVATDEQTGQVQYDQTFPAALPDFAAKAQRNARHVQELFPECAVVLYEDAEEGMEKPVEEAANCYDAADQGPPPGFREWMENFIHAMKADPELAAMFGHQDAGANEIGSEPDQNMAQCAGGTPVRYDVEEALLGGLTKAPEAGLNGGVFAGAGQFGKAPSLGIPDRLSPNSPPMGPDYGKPGAIDFGKSAVAKPVARALKPGAIDWGGSPPPAVTSPHQQARELVMGREAASRNAARASANTAMDKGMNDAHKIAGLPPPSLPPMQPTAQDDATKRYGAEGEADPLTCLKQAAEQHPELKAMLERLCPEALQGNGMALGKPEQPPLPSPGEQNVAGARTVTGAAAGGFIGGAFGHPGAGAAIGAALGNTDIGTNREPPDTVHKTTNNYAPAGQRQG